MDSLYLLFRSSLRWNTAGALVYQLLLITHQAVLFKNMTAADYGLMSIVLSMTYLGALIADGGFDVSLSIFFGTISKNKREFMRLTIPQWIVEGITAGIVASLFAYVSRLNVMTQALSPLVITSAAVMLVAESFRRSLRMTLQLAFKAHLVSIVDVGMLVCYLIFIWASHATGTPLTLELLLPPLAFASLASACTLAIMVVLWMQTLPSNSYNNGSHTITHRQFTTHRLINSGNLIAHQIFSGNILVPLVAMSSGLSDAGIVKLASYLAHGLVTISRKIFGFSGAALLSALKKSSYVEKQHAFWRLSQALYTTLLFSVIAVASMSSHLSINQSNSSHSTFILCFLIVLILSEGLFLVYETIYIVEEKALYLVVLNGTAALVTGLLLACAPKWLSTPTLLGTILSIRFLLFGIMAIGAFKLFDLYPPRPTMSSRLFTRATALAGLAYLCGTPLALLLTR